MKLLPKILVFAGSIRSGSYNQQLANSYVGVLSKLECEVTRITLSDYNLPLYDGNFEDKKGVPENAVKLARLFTDHDGVIIVGPEYNGSLTPLLKNTLDWISRVKPEDTNSISPFKNRFCAIAAASPGAMGGYSSLTHLRQVLVRLGMQVISEQLAVGNAMQAFDDMDCLSNERQQAMLEAACKSLIEKATISS